MWDFEILCGDRASEIVLDICHYTERSVPFHFKISGDDWELVVSVLV
jgi:hypothetical protein